MIRVQNVSKVYPTRFGEKLILDDISFQLSRGEKLGILGRNGAGKSTLIRLISGAESPTSGRIESDLSISWPLAFGGAFQTNLTGIDNVRFISRIYSQDFEKNLRFVEDFAELGDYLREEVRTYSSGMKARLAFAISMITEFDCFLIDEVGAVGDARFHDRCNVELFEKRADRAMIIVSHDPSYIRDHCDRFAILHEGKLSFHDDFDLAYSLYREQIGLSGGREAQKRKIARNRRQLIENTHTTAMQDEAFSALVFDAHMRGKERKWEDAERLYREALERQPYQRSYWVQVGHAAKEAGALIRSEAAYRTACALGEPVAEVEHFLKDVLSRQNVPFKDFPLLVYNTNDAHLQPPSIPDIEMFVRLCWGDEAISDDQILYIMRTFKTCDQMVAYLVSGAPFIAAQRAWIEDHRADKIEPTDVPRGMSNSEAVHLSVWARNLASVAALSDENADLVAMAVALENAENPWSLLVSWGGLSEWEATQEALARLKDHDPEITVME